MADADFGYITPDNIAFFTDLYELTMMQGYLQNDHPPDAVFDLFVRDLPQGRGYLLAAGLEQVIHYLEHLTFSDAALDYVNEQGFDDAFLDWLAGFEFTGDVRAVPEGTPVFPDEPLIEVEAPIMQAQLLETMLINQVAFQSLIATKAARVRTVVERHGDEQTLVDFGSRRAHGTDAGMKAARASYIGGFTGTSNVAAGEAFGIPVFGTMAHSWIESFDTEQDAFEAYVEQYGEESILLIDTYDTLAGAELARDVADETGIDIRGVRIDSGDLPALSQQVQEIVGDIGVFVSSGLDEYRIRQFFAEGGVASGFGVGTNLVTSRDEPAVEAVYKLVAAEQDGTMQPRMKLSEGKVTYPGRKTVHRVEEGGTYQQDVIAQQGEDVPGEQLLVDIVRDGEQVYDPPALDAIQERAARERRKLPGRVRDITSPADYPVTVSDRLQETTDRLQEQRSKRSHREDAT